MEGQEEKYVVKGRLTNIESSMWYYVKNFEITSERSKASVYDRATASKIVNGYSAAHPTWDFEYEPLSTPEPSGVTPTGDIVVIREGKRRTAQFRHGTEVVATGTSSDDDDAAIGLLFSALAGSYNFPVTVRGVRHERRRKKDRG